MNTYTKIIKAVQDYSNEDQENYDLYLKVYAALEKHDGEKITKRLATSVQKSLGEKYQVYYSMEYSMYYINIRLVGQSSDQYKRFLIGYTHNPIFRLKSGDINASKYGLYSERGFDYFSCSYGDAAKERIAKNSKVVKSGKLEKYASLVDQIAKLEKEIQKLKLESYDFPAKYHVDKALRGEKC